MRCEANFAENVVNASKANDKHLVRELVLDEVSYLIEEKPAMVGEALRKSDIDVSNENDKVELINKVSKNIIHNRVFQKNISVAIAHSNLGTSPRDGDFASSDGESGGDTAGLYTAIANAVGSGFQFGTSTQQLKAEEEKAKASMYSKIFGEQEKKVNWLPIIAVTGVLLIGGLVAWRATAKG